KELWRAGHTPTAGKVGGRAVIGDGAPFDAQRHSLGVQGWSQVRHRASSKNQAALTNTGAKEKLRVTFEVGRGTRRQNSEKPPGVFVRAYFPSLFLRQYFNSGLISVISMPALTRNLQLRRSCGWSSSVSLPTTRQYWQ